MYIKKLNIKSYLPNLHQYVYLRSEDAILVDGMNDADIEQVLRYIIDTRGNKTISMAINDAYIVCLCNDGKLPLPEEHFGINYYIAAGHADKQALIYYAMKNTGYTNSGLYLASLESKIILHDLHEIQEQILI